MEHRIIAVEPGSPAEQAGIRPGDTLLKVNHQEIQDVFDFRSLTQEETLTLSLRNAEDSEKELSLSKEEYEDTGLVFENDLMSDYRSCSNQCIFCFIDQMPKGMRDTLYFKDDDSRLSFLQGNYITLTNMREEEIQRIIKYRLSPMNISVHTTNPALRCKMLHNRFAGEVLRYLKDFYEAGITMNGQVVLCKGWNDGEELERTLKDLYEYVPVLESLSIVPVGLTRYREGLEQLEPFTKEDAGKVIDTVEKWQKRAWSEKKLHFVHASDEFYFLAEREMPEEARYDGYLQIENGVGMTRSLLTEAENTLKDRKKGFSLRKKKASFATGLLAEPVLQRVDSMVKEHFKNQENLIYGIPNEFFGEKITVAGLLTGQDLIRALKGKELGSVLYLPSCMFRAGEEVFLDDVTRKEVEEALHTKVRILRSGGDVLVRAMSGKLKKADIDTAHGAYEL